jgi:pimeloyl-ACP methyl ester carboxylesterase
MAEAVSRTRVPFVRRHPIFIGTVLVLLAALTAVLVTVAVKHNQSNARQDKLQPFYTPPSPLPAGPPGTIIRSEPLSIGPAGSRGWRVLYVSEDARGNRVATSGMVFAPTAPAPPGGYPVVAWAHGTVGMGVSCAPSRSTSPLGQLTWLNTMIENGWVVTATDYNGLGTPGTLKYLVGEDAARDVLNSIRTARTLTGAGTRFSVYGHSQGGASALWTGRIAPTYAPELQLVSVAAAAPAAELEPLLEQQWKTSVGWAIGAEVLVGWPAAYPELSADQIATRAGRNNYKSIAEQCVLEAALEGTARKFLGQEIFSKDPNSDPQWHARILENTARPLPSEVPVMVIQGLDDDIVLPNTTAVLARDWCKAGSNITMAWLGDQGHMTLGKVGGPLATTWLQQRFAGIPAQSTCGTTIPVTPFVAGN